MPAPLSPPLEDYLNAKIVSPRFYPVWQALLNLSPLVTEAEFNTLLNAQKQFFKEIAEFYANQPLSPFAQQSKTEETIAVIYGNLFNEFLSEEERFQILAKLELASPILNSNLFQTIRDKFIPGHSVEGEGYGVTYALNPIQDGLLQSLNIHTFSSLQNTDRAAHDDQVVEIITPPLQKILKAVTEENKNEKLLEITHFLSSKEYWGKILSEKFTKGELNDATLGVNLPVLSSIQIKRQKIQNDISAYIEKLYPNQESEESKKGAALLKNQIYQLPALIDAINANPKDDLTQTSLIFANQLITDEINRLYGIESPALASKNEASTKESTIGFYAFSLASLVEKNALAKFNRNFNNIPVFSDPANQLNSLQNALTQIAPHPEKQQGFSIAGLWEQIKAPFKQIGQFFKTLLKKDTVLEHANEKNKTLHTSRSSFALHNIGAKEKASDVRAEYNEPAATPTPPAPKPSEENEPNQELELENSKKNELQQNNSPQNKLTPRP